MTDKILVVTLLMCFFGSVKAQDHGEFRNLGSQIHSTTLQGSTFVEDKRHRPFIYTVARGRPAHLIGVDLNTNTTIVDLPLANTDGSWGITVASDGMLYVSTAQGRLFKHQPGSQEIEDLGIALDGERVIWDVVAGRNGEVYGATYPGCKIFRYHPEDGFKEISDGPVMEGQQYARYLAYDPRGHKLYVGVRIGISIHEFDLNTGKRKMILSELSLNSKSFYNLKLVNTDDGTKLLVGLSGSNSSSSRRTLVFDTKTSQITDTLQGMDVRYLLNKGSELYYSFGNSFYKSNISSKKCVSKKIGSVNGEIKASNLFHTSKIQWLTENGDLSVYDIKTSKFQIVKLQIPKLPIDIQSILFGPDGRVWTSGYLAGGNAAFDPSTQKTTEYKGLIQSEGMSKQGKSIYFGVYPGARLYRFDTDKAWDVKNSNPRLIKQVRGQSRPFAILSIDTAEKIYFGTIPEYAQLGGAIVEYDTRTHKTITFENIVHNQSPVALVFKNAALWGGSSISGGLGIKATEKEAKLFQWDMEGKKTIYETVPVPGAMAITALINGPDGNLWGIADGYLFVFDVSAKKVIHSQQIYIVPPGRTHSWRDASLIIHPSGKVYGTGGQNLFVIDRYTMKVEIIRKNLSLLTMDSDGTFYLKHEADLWSYKPRP